MGKSKELFTEMRAKQQAEEDARKHDPNYQPQQKGYQFQLKQKDNE